MFTDYNVSLYRTGNIADSLFISYLDSSGFYYRLHNSGEVELNKLDTVNGIISGTFQFTLFNNATGDSLMVTDGRFDFRFGVGDFCTP